MNKQYLIIFILVLQFLKLNAQHKALSTEISLQIKREFGQTRVITEAVKKRDIIKKICGGSQSLEVFPILWMKMSDDFNSGLKDHFDFFKDLRFAKTDLTSVGIEQVDISKLLFEGIIYDKCLNPIVSYSESKQFYIPSLSIKNLFEIINKNNIVFAFYIINLDKNNPYFLVNKKKEVFVYYNTYENDTKPFVFVKLSDYKP